MADLGIVIVNWNTAKLLEQCLASIQKYAPKTVEIYVVDNHSLDESVDMVKKKFPDIQLIQNKQNLGFAKANNQVLKKITTRFILLLNPDTKLTHGSIEPLLDNIQNNKVGACGPQLINPDGTLQKQGYYRKLPSLLQVLLFYTDLHRITLKVPLLVKRWWESEVHSTDKIEVDQIPGACLMIRLETLRQMDFLNEAYPIWFEDVDLCFNLKIKGYKLLFVPQSKVVHVGGASFDQWSDRENKETRFWKSMFIFFRENYGLVKYYLARTIIFLNLVFLSVSRSLMQILDYKADRQKFIHLEIQLLKNLYFMKAENKGLLYE